MENQNIPQASSLLGSMIHAGEETCKLSLALVEAVELCPRLCQSKVYQPICIPVGS